MTERERWIVYPLLFFALGAALRDKLLHEVQTKDLVCETLRIVDPHNKQRTLAVFASRPDERSETGELLAVLRVDRFECEGLQIADEENPGQVLVALGVSDAPNMPVGDTSGKRVGVLALWDETGGEICEMRPDRVQLSVSDGATLPQALAIFGTGRVSDIPGGERNEPVGAVVLRDASGGRQSEMRPDRLTNPTVACKQLYVVEPVGGQPRIVAATNPVTVLDPEGAATVADHEGVLILNNTPIVVRRPPGAAAPSAAP